MLFHKKKLLIHIGLLLFLTTSVLHAQYFKPLRSFRTIKTEHFDIIFPQESERTANLVASFADETYNEISGLLGIELHRRWPVVINPDTEQFNGFAMSFPSQFIMLFDTPMDLEFTTYENQIRGLFLHELTHAISMNSRSPFFEVMHRIFGNWVLPAGLLNAPDFMIEGVTVSFESLSGFGRTNDPLIKEKIRQAIYEENTLTPFQLTKTNDLLPNFGAYYEYGGLFSAYLQQNYGMEKYAEFWQKMGSGIRFSFNVYKSGSYKMFSEVYGIPFMEAWTNFLDSLALNNIVENSQSIPLKTDNTMINVLAASKDAVYFGISYDFHLWRYDPHTETIEKVMSMDPSIEDIAVSPDGTTLLLSGYHSIGNRAEAVVTEYHASNGRRTGRDWDNLYRAQYFRDGLIAIGSNLHNNNIVYTPSVGTEEILLHGNEEITYASPHAIDEDWIIYIRASKGLRQLAMFNYETKEEYIVTSNLPDDVLRWKYIRNLRVSNGKVMFVYNHDDRMYKLGVIDVAQLVNGEESIKNVVFSSSDYSGGVFLPAHIEGTIYYRGYFSSEDKLMQFPETVETLSGTIAEISLVPSDKNGFLDSSAAELTNTVTENNESKAYFGLKYMNPFQFWYPVPLLRNDGDDVTSLDGMGIHSEMIDPIASNIIVLNAIGDWKAKMANVNVSWTNDSLGIPLTLAFTDGVEKMYGNNSYRYTEAALSALLLRTIGNERNTIGVLGGVEFSIHADNPFDKSSAYTWDYDDPTYSGFVGLILSNKITLPGELFGTGIDIGAMYSTPHDFSQKRVDGSLNIALEKVFPLQFQFYGAYDTNGMDLHGSSRQYDSSFPLLASVEYSSPDGLSAEWLAGGEAELRLFKFEIQNHLSYLYFRRIFSTLAYRGVLYDGQELPDAEGNRIDQDLLLAQSLILRLGFDISVPVVQGYPIILSPYVSGAWKISNMNDGKNNDYYIHVGIRGVF
jgi:tetrahydromethanopterin S-methyltransferase subunit G